MHGFHGARLQTENLDHILDPCYHVARSGTSTPCSARSNSSNSTWSDDVGMHDPDFQPFETTSRRASFASTAPPSRSFDLPTPSTKAGRIAARNQLEPELRAAVIAHELALEQELHRKQHHAWRPRRRSAEQDELPADSALDADDEQLPEQELDVEYALANEYVPPCLRAAS